MNNAEIVGTFTCAVCLKRIEDKHEIIQLSRCIVHSEKINLYKVPVGWVEQLMIWDSSASLSKNRAIVFHVKCFESVAGSQYIV
jgi:hypothetical protein